MTAIPGDHQVPSPPQDSISSLKFAPSPRPDIFCTGAWDNTVNVYQYQRSGLEIQSKPVLQIPATAHTQAVLAVGWKPDATQIFTGSVDKTGKIWDLNSNQVLQYAAHNEAIKSAFWVDGYNMVVTVEVEIGRFQSQSFGQGNPAATVNLSDKVYAMDVKGDTLVVACADKQIHIIDLRNPSAIVKSQASPLRHQIRTVSIFHDRKGLVTLDDGSYAIGSIEGRVQIMHFADSEQVKNFAFKCHRDTTTQDIYAVNCIVFHNQYGTFCTAGSDGTFHFWDKDAKQRLKGFNKLANSISACDFNASGDTFAYAIGYDWSKGYDQQNRNGESIWLHAVQESEIKPKK